MPRLGTTSTDFFRFSRLNTDNVVADLYTMPENGWIRDIAVAAGGYNETTYARLCLWEYDGSLVQSSPQQTWNSGRGLKHADMGAIRIEKGERFFAGFWRDPRRAAQWATLDNGNAHQVQSYIGHYGAPGRLDPHSNYPGQLTAYVDYHANHPPERGQFLDSSPSQTISETEPTFSGTLNHPPGDRELDYSTQFHIRIYNKTTRRIVLDREYTTLASERVNEAFSRAVYTHETGHSYYAEYRHRDTWGVYSQFSPQIHYAIGNGPDAPTITSPGEGSKVNTGTPAVSGTYSHPNGFSSHSVQIELYDSEAKRLLDTSAWMTMSGSAFSKTFSECGFDALGWGQTFHVRARTRDSRLVVGTFSSMRKFRTNAYPFIPSSLTPHGGRPTSDSTLRCSISDPDGDSLTVLAYLYSSSGTLVGGYPRAMTVSPDGRTAALDAASHLTLGSSYTWRASASDGSLTSSLSAPAGFTYTSVPLVTLTSPSYPASSGGSQINEARQPSAEYESAVGYWSLDSPIVVTSDEDAAHGVSSWESTVTSGGSATMRTPLFNLTASRPFKLFAAFKGYSGDARSYLALECFNSGGASLGSVVVSDSEPDDFWARRGRTIIPSEYPANTTRARVVCRPAHLPSEAEATNRVDAFDWGLLDAGSTASGDIWRGYFDGDTERETGGYGPPRISEQTGEEIPVYEWMGTPGDSASRGLPVLTTPSNVEVAFTYSSAAGRAKTDDRLIIERYSGTAWVERFRTDFGEPKSGGAARTSIPIPPGTFDSGSRYRLQLTVRDSLGLEAQTDYVEFDVRYKGPPEVVVSQVAGDASRAEITVSFAPTTLSELEYDGLEIEVQQSDGERITHLITDPSATSFTYRYPESGYRHRIRLRQAQLVSDERIEGEWTEVEGSVDFFPLFFVKSVEDPDLFISFFVLSRNRPSHKPVRNRKRYETWGSKRAKFAVGRLRTNEGSLMVSLFDDPQMRFTNVTSAEEKLRILEELEEREDVVCILSQKPTRKRFCTVTDWGSHTTNDAEDYETEITWEEVDFLEDYRLKDSL